MKKVSRMKGGVLTGDDIIEVRPAVIGYNDFG